MHKDHHAWSPECEVILGHSFKDKRPVEPDAVIPAIFMPFVRKALCMPCMHNRPAVQALHAVHVLLGRRYDVVWVRGMMLLHFH